MGENENGVRFVNCIGSDINLWKKGPSDDTFELETCLLFDEPDLGLYDSIEDNTTWKFIDHITKRYLLGNGQKIFNQPKYGTPLMEVKITTPLYTLKELCEYTIATRLLVNKSAKEINTLELPKKLKIDLQKRVKYLADMYEQDCDDYIYDWTTCHEETYNS